jgi:hypothetical protein
VSGTSFPFSFPSPFGSGFSFVPDAGGGLAALQFNAPNIHASGVDRLLDPNTLDYVRTENGEWAETADNRTTVLIALSVRHGRSPYDPDQGSTIAERIESGFGLTPEYLRSETERVMSGLERNGILSGTVVTTRDLDGAPLRDSAGRLAVKLDWRDLSSGSPAVTTTTFSPR